MSIRNPGPLLTLIFRGTLEHIPPEWRAKLGLKKFDQQQPNDVDEDSLSGQLIGSQVDATRTDERKKTNVQLLDSPTGKSTRPEKASSQRPDRGRDAHISTRRNRFGSTDRCG